MTLTLSPAGAAGPVEPAPIPPYCAAEDARRTAAIVAYDVLGRPPRRELVAMADLAARISGVPMASVNLITAGELHQVATVGLPGGVCRREDAPCSTVLDEGRPILLPDARDDARFRHNPFVTGELGSIRFYAAHPLRTPEGVAIGTLCVFDQVPHEVDDTHRDLLATLADRVVDVLQLELTARRLESANARLAVSNERLGAFAGQVSHDLKNPLAAISMSLELARDEAVDASVDAMVLSLLDRASRGAQRMDVMIGDLLAFARAGAEPERVPTPLGALAADVVEDLAGALDGVTVTVGELPEVAGDPVQLRLLLQNLVANAATFTRDGEPAAVTVSAGPIRGGWRVEVADNGRGVPDDQRERVFDPLVRLDKKVPGSGIGLSTCHRIVEAHGGRIGLAPAPGGGTTAWFELLVEPS